MGDKREPLADTKNDGDGLPSVEQVASLDAYLDTLAAERRPAPRGLTPEETRAAMLAAQLRLAREDVEAPAPAFLQTLEQKVGRAVAEHAAQQTRSRRAPGVSRGRFLRAAATVAGGAGLGIAGVEGVSVAQEARRPHELVVAGNERWYDIAALGEVAPGGTKPFSAGGVLGFLLNDEGQLHAVSAICTHMGCRLKPAGVPGHAAAELHCLCHGSRFARRGTVVQGLAPSPLPRIALRVENGRVYALGTRETV